MQPACCVQEAAQRRTAGTTRGILRLFALARDEVCVLLLASVMLLAGSLAAVAVPKLAGQLLDICINISKFSSKAEAEKKANGALHAACLQVMQVPGLLAKVTAVAASSNFVEALLDCRATDSDNNHSGGRRRGIRTARLAFQRRLRAGHGSSACTPIPPSHGARFVRVPLSWRTNNVGIKIHIRGLTKFASVLQNWVSSIVCEQESS